MNFEQLKQGEKCPWFNMFTIHLLSREDLPDLYEMLGDPAVTEYLFFAPAPEEQYQGFFEPVLESIQRAIEESVWPENPTFIIRDQTGTFMGMCGLTCTMFVEGNFAPGFILPRHSWRQGLATAACRFLTELAFLELGAHKVAADCYATNTGSYKTLEKNGYRLEGRQEAYYKAPSGYIDKLLYGLTLEQYKALSLS